MPNPDPATPKKVGDLLSKAIHELNFNWDLQLQHLHGRKARAAENTHQLAARCAGILHYLAFKVDPVCWDRLLNDFHDRAHQLYSSWKFKPRQEPGTLPSPLKNRLKTDVQRKRVLGLDSLTQSQRNELLKALEHVLSDEFKLAKDSESFRLSSTPREQSPSPAPRPASTARRLLPWQTESDWPRRLRSDDTQPVASPNPNMPAPRKKRSSTGAAPEVSCPYPRPNPSDPCQPKRTKIQTKTTETPKDNKIQSYFPQSKTQPINQLSNQKSFDTVASSSASDVFDTPGVPSRSSSLATTVASETEEKDESQDLFPTQEAADLLEDFAVQQSLDAPTSASNSFSFKAETVEQKLNATFKSFGSKLPPDITFDFLYEIWCLAYLWKMELLEVYKKVEKKCKNQSPDRNERFLAYKAIQKEEDLPAPEVFGELSWSPAAGLAPGKETHKSTYLNATLSWAAKSSEPLLNVRLQGPKTDKSCRFHREFGGQRFMILQVPFAQWTDLPTHLKPHQDVIQANLAQWLASEHFITGRYWRAFYVDDSPPKQTKDKASFNRVHLFAVRGAGLSEDSTDLKSRCLSIESFIDRHIPIRDGSNIGSTDLKLFQRFKLGLSKTTPTIVLKQHQFRKVEDVMGDDGKEVMSDGSGRMSLSLGLAIQKQLGIPTLPTALQGRISGAKGLWVVDLNGNAGEDYWLEVSPSQLKIKPHPYKRKASDEHRRFEVTKWSGAADYSPALNVQFLTVLQHCGVTFDVLKGFVEVQMNTYYEDLLKAMSDPCLLRAWLQQYHTISRDVTEYLGAFPRGNIDQLFALIDAGFDGRDQGTPLRELVLRTMKDELAVWVEKLRITVPEESTFLYCIPDPLGVLQPGQVHLSLSQPWTDPRTGIQSFDVKDRDGLVARNPANLPSDIQKIRFVRKSELENYRDVLIYSVKGNRPLANYLSGGDYDGDQCWACWQPDIVDGHQNDPNGPPDHITPEQCGLEQKSQKLSQRIGSVLNGDSVVSFLEPCIDFNIKSPMVGRCTAEHERVAYHKGLGHPGAIKLAALAAFLVDARKQGYELSEQNFGKVRLECSGKKQLTSPAYKASGAEAPTKWKQDNVIDRLRYEVASPRRHWILQDFHQKWNKDMVASLVFKEVWLKAQDAARRQKEPLEVLHQMQDDIKAVQAEWQKRLGVNRSQSNVEDAGQYPVHVRACYQQYVDISPKKTTNVTLFHQLMELDGGTYWRLLRASCLYSTYNMSRLTWHLAGNELLQMKLQKEGMYRGVCEPVYGILKTDTKAVKARFAAEEEKAATDVSGPIDVFLRR
jgi:hypothetical protein